MSFRAHLTSLILILFTFPAQYSFASPEKPSKIIFASQKNCPPFEYLDAYGQPAGVMHDLVKAMETTENFDSSFKHASFFRILKMVESGKVDVVTSIYHSPERLKRFDFTEKLFDIPAYIYIHKDTTGINTIQTLTGRNIAMQKGDFALEFLDRKGIKYNKIIFTENLSESIKLLKSGEADVIIGDQPLVNYCIYENNLSGEFKIVGEPLFIGKLCMAVKKGNTKVLNQLNTALRSPEARKVLKEIKQKWFGTLLQSPASTHTLRLLVFGLAILICLLVITWIWDFSLRTKVKKRTLKLQNSKRQLATIFHSAPQGMIIARFDGTILQINRQGCRLCGCSNREARTYKMNKFITSDIWNAIYTVISKNNTFNNNAAWTNNFNEEKEVIISASTIEYDNETAILFHISDITEKAIVQRQNAAIAAVMDSSDDVAAFKDSSGKILAVSRAYVALTGLSSKEQVLGRTEEEVWGVNFKDNRLCNTAEEEQVMLTQLAGQVMINDCWLTIHDAGKRYYLIKKFPIFDQHSTLLGFGIIAQDRTRYKAYESSILKQKESIAEIIDSLPVGIITRNVQQNGVITLWNRWMEDHWQLKRDKIVGCNPSTMNDELICAPLFDENDQLIFHSRNVFSYPTQQIKLHNSTFWGNVRKVPIFDQYGQPETILTIVEDVTADKEYEQQLGEALKKAEAANVSKSLFLANMNHELRTPLNGLIGMTQLLEETTMTSEQSEYVETIDECGKTLMNLIGDILEISKIEAGKASIKVTDCNLDKLFEELKMCFWNQVNNKENFTLDFNLDPDVPKTFRSDPNRIKQILINLIGNAIKFTSEGSVKVNCRLVDKHKTSATILWEVHDTGIGIPDDALELIFENFQQVDSFDTKQFQGTGLGLAICRKIVELMDGEISVSSNLGKGSTFSFRLPVWIEHSEQTEQPSETSAHTMFDLPENLNILVAEDNKINRKILTKMLDKINPQLDYAFNGEEAVDKFKAGSYDMILMDVQMPVMDGIQATRLIREIEKETGGHIPIIAVTAHATVEEKEHFLKEGVDGFVAKPVILEKILCAIAELIEPV